MTTNGVTSAQHMEITPASLSREGLAILGRYQELSEWALVVSRRAEQDDNIHVRAALKGLAGAMGMGLEDLKLALAREAAKNGAATVQEASKSPQD